MLCLAHHTLMFVRCPQPGNKRQLWESLGEGAGGRRQLPPILGIWTAEPSNCYVSLLRIAPLTLLSAHKHVSDVFIDSACVVVHVC